jgi:mannose-6-phosphate isomerase-like protein (cupin superfamily)
MKVRRVVTGHDSGGRAVFASDEELVPMTLALQPGVEYHQVWGSDEIPAYPDDGSRPLESTFFPSVNGYRFFILVLPPAFANETPPAVDPDVARREMEEKMPGALTHVESDDPGMHTTDTADFEIVLSGELTLELDDGAEKVLRRGDTNIQNGTRHRWHNRGTEPAVMACFLIGASRKSR